ncbi:restriction endonuclease-related protein [Streptomyces lydicus]|uniref:restriction endonuclease-related protein n=1 Tax=Streptomyces lydicus TaxID=47763 RepID=UPI0037AB9054
MSRDLSLTACCAAAAVETDSDIPARQKASRLMDCLGVLRSAHPPASAAALDMRTLRAGLRSELSRLLPGDSHCDVSSFAGMTLIDADGALGVAVEDLGREHLVEHHALREHWPWARMRAEQEEQRLHQEIRRLPSADYERVRLLLATHPAGEQTDLWKQWGDLWGRFGFFEPVESWPWCNVAGWCFLCPKCRWPMRAQRLERGAVRVRCDAHAAEGIDGTARPRRNGQVPEWEAAGWDPAELQCFPIGGDFLAVSRTVWRYFSLPGQMEVAQRDALMGIPGLRITMYPHRDAWDFSAVAGAPVHAKEWRVDAKAWCSGSALADALRERAPFPGPVPLTIAIPWRQRSELPALRQAVRGRGDMCVTTDRELVGEIRRWCGMAS